MRHKWDGKKCLNCGIEKKTINKRILMAIVNHPPWEGYTTETFIAYSKDGFKTYSNKAGNCQPQNK